MSGKSHANEAPRRLPATIITHVVTTVTKWSPKHSQDPPPFGGGSGSLFTWGAAEESFPWQIIPWSAQCVQNDTYELELDRNRRP